MANPSSRVTVDFVAVRRKIETATQWFSLATGFAQFGGDPTDHQKKAAAELRAAADLLDPPAEGARG